jgi:2-polyprenyl-6-methoxyphenol hydroxylase-like FAD-dependent oxidoreductase
MNNVVHTRCCIAGGGPAGMMSALLLARIGVDVFVLEKHADFLRDFRGDTIHPSTLEIMYELGILEEFLKRPHQEVRELAGQVGEETVTRGDFTHLPTHCHFLALMPQWDFLNFVVEQARRYPTFHLKMQAEVSDLIVEQGVVVGAQAKTPDGNLEIRASLTIGADGRHSVIRRRAGLEVKNLGAPMDVMWMRIRRHPNDPVQTFGHIDRGRILVLINREDYWQCAFVIPKGTADEIRQRGLSSFREEVTSLAPFLSDRLQELRDWKDISVLTVAVDRLVQWSRAGVLSIGDAAHAMSPIGGGRHQSGHSGRSRNGKLTRRKTSARNSERRRASDRPAASEASDLGHPADSNHHPKQSDRPRSWQAEIPHSSMAAEALAPMANSAANSCSIDWDWRPSGARENARK